MNKGPLVSIVMPMFNAEGYIGEAVQSCVAQSYANWELIVVNDCSSDNSLQIVESFDDERIRVSNNQQNLGEFCSRNVALEKAKGEWITMLDADDVFHPHRLEILLHYSSPSVVLFDKLRRFQGVLPPPSTLMDEADETELLAEIDVPLTEWLRTYDGGAQPFFHRSLLASNVAYRTGATSGMDTLFLLEIVSKTGSTLKYIDAELYFYRLVPTSITASKIAHLEATKRSIDIALGIFESSDPITPVLRERRSLTEDYVTLYLALEGLKRGKLGLTMTVLRARPRALTQLPQMVISKAKNFRRSEHFYPLSLGRTADRPL